jgi:uncharacterized protein YceK
MPNGRKNLLILTVPLILIMLLALLLASGCGSSNSDSQAEYQKGYADGVKSEQAMWSDQKMQLAKTMLEEQASSQENVNRLFNGEVSDVSIGEVKVEGDTATVKIAVHFKDGTVINGTIAMGRVENIWYFKSITSEKGATSS